MTAKTRLSKKRRVFVEEYLKCWNGAEAARRAGYKYPRRRASVLLTNLDITEYIEKRISEIAMSADEVLLRLGEQARADFGDYIDQAGYIDIDKLKKNGKTHLIKKYKMTRLVSGKIRVELEGHDPQRALELLGKHHRLFVERKEIASLDLTALTTEQLERIASGEDVLHVLATPGAS